MANIIKPSFSGLATGHPRYARLHKFYNFGTDNRELVADTALTVSGMALVNDADVGDSRSLVTGAAMTQTISIPQDATVIVVVAGRGARLASATFFGNGLGTNSVEMRYNYGSGGRFQSGYRGASGTTRSPLYANAFSSDAQYLTGLAFGATLCDTETMTQSLNGVTQTNTYTTGGAAFASSPVQMPFASSVDATANFSLAAIIVLTGISTEAELNADTTNPWAFLQQAATLDAVDGDDSISQGQQDIVINVSNIPTGMVPIRAGAHGTAGVGGTDFTGFSVAAGTTSGSYTITADVPVGIATSTSTQCYVEYDAE